MNSLVLIVDDEPHMLRFIEFTLRKGPFEIITAKDGAEAIQLSKTHNLSVIVMDVLIPGVDGLTAMKAIKSDLSTRHIPIIMLTARSRSLDAEALAEEPTVHYMNKPFSPRELRQQVLSLSAGGEEAITDPARTN